MNVAGALLASGVVVVVLIAGPLAVASSEGVRRRQRTYGRFAWAALVVGSGLLIAAAWVQALTGGLR